MLRIYDTALALLTDLKPILVAVERHDRDLARQLRRCSASVAQNISEGSGSRAGTRTERYLNALGSAREVSACLDIAVAFGYTMPAPTQKERLSHIIGVLVVVTRR